MFRPPQPASMTLNLAPMVDVLMCLIIFFLLASSLVDREHLEEVRLPFAIAAKELDKSELGARITINVRKSAESAAAGAEYVVIDWDGRTGSIVERVIEPSALETLLRSRKAQADIAKSKLRCVIRADQDVTYQDVEAVLRACGLAKVSDIVFSAKSGVEPPGGGP